MLRLPSPDPAWADLARGVRVLHRPASPAEVAAADSWARGRVAQALQDHAAEVARVAELLPGAEIASPNPDHLHSGFVVIALGRLCIADWCGVADHHGAPLPCTPDAVAELLKLPDMASAYVTHALGLNAALAAEGNGSAPAPTGISAAGAATAPHA